MHIDSVLIAGMAAGSVLVKRMSQEIFMKLTYILLLYQEYCLWLSSFENFIGGKIYDKFQVAYVPVGVPTFHLESAQKEFENQ